MKYLLIIYLLAATSGVCNNSNNLPKSESGETSIAGNSITDSTKDAANNETLAGKWFLQPVLPSDTASGKIPTIDFDLKTSRFSGNSGCNGISGSFTLNGDALSFSENIMSTKMACPGYNEKAFFDNLLKTNRYQIKNGVLQLMFNTTVLSNWARKVDTTTSKQI